jgi:hypothetical protein
MAKGRSQRNREEKKPKGAKKPSQASPTFLRPQQPGTPPTTKQSAK